MMSRRFSSTGPAASVYGGMGGGNGGLRASSSSSSSSRRSKRRPPPTAREQWIKAVQNGDGMMTDNGIGGPPRSGLVNPAAASTSAYLTNLMNRAAPPIRSERNATGNLVSPYVKAVYPVKDSKSVRKSMRRQEANQVHDVENLCKTVYELKKEILAYNNERDLLRSKIAQLERQNSRKAAKIDNLAGQLEGRVAPYGSTLSLKEDSKLVTSLKQQVHDLQDELEQAAERMMMMESDIRYTQAEEGAMQASAYYDEILRLQKLLELRDEGGDTSAITPGGGQYGAPSLSSFRTVKERCRTLETQNNEIKADLKQALETAIVLKEQAGAEIPEEEQDSDYYSMTRNDMFYELQRLTEEVERLSLKERQEKEDERIGKTTEEFNSRDRRTKLMSARIEELEEENARLIIDNSKLQSKLKAVKKSRHKSTYDDESGNDSEASTRSKKSKSKKSSRKDRSDSLKRSSAKRSPIVDRKPLALKNRDKDQSGEEMGAAGEEEEEEEEEKKAKKSTKSKFKIVVSDEEEAEVNEMKMQSAAAVTFQKHWRRRKAQEQAAFLRKHKVERDQAIQLLQNTFRGFLGRRRLAVALRERGWERQQDHDNYVPTDIVGARRHQRIHMNSGSDSSSLSDSSDSSTGSSDSNSDSNDRRHHNHRHHHHRNKKLPLKPEIVGIASPAKNRARDPSLKARPDLEHVSHRVVQPSLTDEFGMHIRHRDSEERSDVTSNSAIARKVKLRQMEQIESIHNNNTMRHRQAGQDAIGRRTLPVWMMDQIDSDIEIDLTEAP